MKKIFTLCVFAFFAIISRSQVVLNEIYTDPGSNKNEFFEFYNTSTSAVPENLDNYTIVTYFEEPGKSGFYVMDIPNLSVAPKGFFVGSSSNPFSVQGQNNLTPDFSWNSMPAGGYLKRFEKNGGTYINAAVPANLNDFFVARSGSGAVHHIMIFKNGLLINGIIAGTNSALIPSYLKSMPPLFVDMSGSSPDFLINFASFNDNQFEYVNSAPGNDNGYIRISDGKCGVWNKSSAASQHTPGKSNGSASGLSGDLTITSTITELSGDYSKSLLIYNVTSASLSAFPVTVETYKDKGLIGQLDAADSLVDSRIIYSLTAGDQYVILPFRNDPVMLVAKSPSGCFDQVRAVANNLTTLPVHLISFQGSMNKSNKVTLNWKVADNETVYGFEVERSFNGRDFSTAGVVFASEKYGTENYMFYETLSNPDKVMYRLKMIDQSHDVEYSKILVFQGKESFTSDIKIIGNPVKDKLTFSFSSISSQPVLVSIYDMNGRMVMRDKVSGSEGINTISLPLNPTFKPGMYVVEIFNGSDRQMAKFIKQ